MTMNLHPECKSRLIEVVADGLPKIITNHGMFIDRKSYVMALYKADEVIPKNGRLIAQLSEYVGEFPVLDFISETLSIELRDLDRYISEPASMPLVEISEYRDHQGVAQRLIDQFETLPWKYTLTITLPEKISGILKPYVSILPLSSDVRLIQPTTEFVAQFPLKALDKRKNERIHGRPSLLFPEATENPVWDETTVALQIDVQGFVGLYGSTTPAEKGNAVLRAFGGLAIALRLLQVEYSYSPIPPKFSFYAHKYNVAWEIDGKFEVGNECSSTLSNLKIYFSIEELRTQQDKDKWILLTLQEIGIVFSRPEKAERIILAAQWLFDSYGGHDELLSFVKAMVVLEILLGDKETSDEIGLGELLRNRCAYLIGKTHQERSQLLKDFKEIYNVRSQIVHRGKSRLTGEERLLFNKLRLMCFRVIQEEVNLLRADSAPAKRG